jgi:transglutaminase-like putative cysteine protease
MLLRVQHETRLQYSQPVSESVFEVRAAPQSSEDQTTLGYRLQMSPPTAVTPYRDGFGNRVELFNILTSYREVVMAATSIVQTHRRPGLARLATAQFPLDLDGEPEAVELLRTSPLVDRSPALKEFVESLGHPSGSLADVVQKLMKSVRGRLKYEKKVTTARTSLGEALALGRGVCQDFTHLFLGACRGLGLPARYVSGYVHQPGEIATHAWCQVWAGSSGGWVDVDPTLNRVVEDQHVVTAVGRDFSDVPPNRGVWRGNAEESIAVSVKVEALDRVPGDWAELDGRVAWVGPQSTPSPSGRGGLAFNLRANRTLYRHQQSQQQQEF